MARKSSETLICVSYNQFNSEFYEKTCCGMRIWPDFSVNMWEIFFLIFNFRNFFWLYSLFCFSTGCSSLKKLLPVNLAMTASAVHSSLYRTKYDGGACWTLQSVWKNIFRKWCAWLYGPACVPALCLFKMSTVVCEYMFHLDGHYTKAQRLSMTISVATKKN